MTAEPLMDKGSAFLCFVLIKIVFGKLWEFIKENYLAMLVIGAVFGLAILSGVTLATIVSVLATAFGYILEVMSI
ncbi:hypothetical protein IGJ51_001050 [Enterococcus sp. DIV0802c]|uniref:hypothetical protein n=1 Tax=Enterococcus sp. DIV0802c TaxID=2774743 RepID=UPI003F1EDFCF